MLCANTLSTSTVTTPHAEQSCFGPVTEDGYGVAYHLHADELSFAVTAYHGSGRDAAAFAEHLENALGTVGRLLAASAEGEDASATAGSGAFGGMQQARSMSTAAAAAAAAGGINVTVTQTDNSDGGGADAITITDACAARIEELRAKQGTPGALLRLSVEGGGCSGFQYTFALDGSTGGDGGGGGGEVNDNDRVFPAGAADGEALVVVDEVSLDLLGGSTVDYVVELVRSSFVVSDNPNAESGCGCGVSFAAKLDF